MKQMFKKLRVVEENLRAQLFLFFYVFLDNFILMDALKRYQKVKMFICHLTWYFVGMTLSVSHLLSFIVLFTGRFPVGE
jgi:hypothetical protein